MGNSPYIAVIVQIMLNTLLHYSKHYFSTFFKSVENIKITILVLMYEKIFGLIYYISKCSHDKLAPLTLFKRMNMYIMIIMYMSNIKLHLDKINYFKL